MPLRIANGKDVRSGDWKAGPAAKAIVTETKKMRGEVVPALEKELGRLQARLAAKGVPVEE